jgi:hypothetical protein
MANQANFFVLKQAKVSICFSLKIYLYDTACFKMPESLKCENNKDKTYQYNEAVAKKKFRG